MNLFAQLFGWKAAAASAAAVLFAGHVAFASPVSFISSFFQNVFGVGTTTTQMAPDHSIKPLTISEAVPKAGKFVAVDLTNMQLYMYKDGEKIDTLPVLTKGRPGTPWATPSGFYKIRTKEENHFSSIGKVYMPYSMQFMGNYFIHGWPYYPDGTPVPHDYSGGCIRLSTNSAKEVYNFADVGTGIFIYDAPATDTPATPIPLADVPVPSINADQYVVADIDTGDVYAEKNGTQAAPIASITKLMSALVGNEIINFEQNVPVGRGYLVNPPVATDTRQETFAVDDLFYPLLMQSSNGVADALASYYGTSGFVKWMNSTASALNMHDTQFADASGVSESDTSTPEDLFRLLAYLYHKKSFILDITHTQNKEIYAVNGTSYPIENVNYPADSDIFDGGKVGHTTAAGDTMASIMNVSMPDGSTRHVAIVILHSNDHIADMTKIAGWFERSLASNTNPSAQASAYQAAPRTYPKIAF